jgi:hypothetical protein
MNRNVFPENAPSLRFYVKFSMTMCTQYMNLYFLSWLVSVKMLGRGLTVDFLAHFIMSSQAENIFYSELSADPLFQPFPGRVPTLSVSLRVEMLDE